MTVSAFIGLGANMDGPQAHVERALGELARLPQTTLTARSSLWRSAPLGYTDQPGFINAVARLETDLSPEALLDALQVIENAHGRVRSFANAPRTLDLDLLLFDDEVSSSPRLTLPHPRMHERAFVLEPLLEVDPGATIPGHGDARDLVAALRAQTCERIA